MTQPVRVRIAPSPTGNLHVGTARTALFNYLYAKRHGGQFILRIEDTDLQRSEAKYIEDIYKGLKLLGLDWDEGPDSGGDHAPYKQSERLDLYLEYVQKLLDAGWAYHCYLTQEELDAEKEKAKQEKRPYVYSGKCRDEKVREELKKDGWRQPSVRFRMPDGAGKFSFHDQIRGEVEFDLSLIGDFVILKSDGTPTYNFAVVIDDLTMDITHVIRGEDHISNTPRQLMIYEALGQKPPEFAHVGMILAPDRSKLSKRHGATAVSTFVEDGYLPEAFCNFLALLGWSPPDNQEIGTLEHFATMFDFDRIAQSSAVFDREKLNWMNGQYIRQIDLDDLLTRCKPYLSDYDIDQYPVEKQRMIIDIVREPLVVLGDITNDVAYFFGKDVSDLSEEAQGVFEQGDTRTVLEAFLTNVVSGTDFHNVDAIGDAMKTFGKAMQESHGLKMKTVMWAIRSAVTGRVKGADLTKTLYILGHDVVTHRVEAALAKLPATTSSS